MRETRRATEWHRLLSGRVTRAEGSDNEIVIWDNDFDNDDFSFSSRPHRLYPVASLLTNPTWLADRSITAAGVGRMGHLSLPRPEHPDLPTTNILTVVSSPRDAVTDYPGHSVRGNAETRTESTWST